MPMQQAELPPGRRRASLFHHVPQFSRELTRDRRNHEIIRYSGLI
jgi:hypothetical protein